MHNTIMGKKMAITCSKILFVCSLAAFSSGFVQNINKPNFRQPLPRLHAEYEKDVVEKIFSFFFGEKEDSPFGLERISKDKFPDQYPAVKNELAEPLAGDSKEVALIRPTLKQTQFETRKLKLAYDANRNGWTPAAFHKAVDRQGPGVIYARTVKGDIVGGYNPKGWVGFGELRPGISAFLFTYPGGDTTVPPIKLRKIGGAGLAVVDKPETGPSFGSDGLVIKLEKSSPKMATSKLGSYYERMPGGGKSIFDTGTVELKEFKAYIGVYGPDEEVPFTDAIPFSLT